MGFKPTWGTSVASAGWAVLGYEWLYIPFCNHLWNVEPWSPTAYGFLFVGLGVMLNVIQYFVRS